MERLSPIKIEQSTQSDGTKLFTPSSTQEINWLIKKSTPFSGSMTDQITAVAELERMRLDGQMQFHNQTDAIYDFKRSDYGDVRAFFDEISDDYDSDLENPYFAFSHEILKFILTKFIKEHFNDNRDIRMFDAGAGTGNWSKFVLNLNESIRGDLFDMNPNMLKVARRKLGKLDTKSIRMVEGNLEEPSDFPAEKSNLILCMHNVIGLGRNTDLILQNLYSHLENGGMAFVMAPNKYHAYNFTRSFRTEEEVLRVIRDGSVKFKPDMPEMFCFTPQEFRKILLRAGFEEVTVLGFPVTLYPALSDVKLLQRHTSEQQLKDPQKRAAALALEKRLCLNPDLAYKGGSSLISVCKKS